jgi:hypothetical protein
MQEYSYFMIKELGKFFIENSFEATHILVVQHDSWIVNPNSWTDEFLNYDYIGAPFACHPNLPQGNGGFSLRSIELCKFLSTNENIVKTEGEDSNICFDYRDLLISNGFKFASKELASLFSVEGRPINNQFGHHCSDKIIKGVDRNGTRVVYINQNKVFPENGYAYTLPTNDEIINYEKYGITTEGENINNMYSDLSKQENKFIEKHNTFEKLYDYFCKIKSDMHEHLPTLKKFIEDEKVESVIELGFRTMYSAVGILAGKPKTMTSYDMMDHWQGVHYPKILEKLIPSETQWNFVQANDLFIELPEVDFIFIDTLHTYAQLSKELNLHSKKAKRFIGFHDTVSFRHRGEDGSPKGLIDAIRDFMKENNEWEIYLDHRNCNGLMIIKRK